MIEDSWDSENKKSAIFAIIFVLVIVNSLLIIDQYLIKIIPLRFIKITIGLITGFVIGAVALLFPEQGYKLYQQFYSTVSDRSERTDPNLIQKIQLRGLLLVAFCIAMYFLVLKL